MDIFTFASSTPLPSVLTRILTLKSTTRFTGTRIFMEIGSRDDSVGSSRPAKTAAT